MAPTQKEEAHDNKGLASPQTRNSGYNSENLSLARIVGITMIVAGIAFVARS